MVEKKHVLVVCVDRDDDLGRKADVQGPVIGRDRNVEAATALAIKDPGEADANAMFAAVKKFDELKQYYSNVEIVTLTGHGKGGFKSDKIINSQLDAVFEKFQADGIVLVTDGAEDDSVMPILQSRAKIISKETVVIKQAQAVESTYYTIKEALKDPYLARIVFGIPGIILMLYFALGTLSLQVLAFIFGVYLILKGFGIEERVLKFSRGITSSVSTQRISFPFYIGGMFILVFGAINAYTNLASAPIVDIVLDSISAVQSTYLFLVLAVLSAIVGRAIDSIHFKKAFRLRRYFIMAVSVFSIWFIMDTATLVFLNQADLNYFLFSILLSFVVLLVAFRVSNIMDVRKRITRLLIGLPVYNAEGIWLGKVSKIDKKRNMIIYASAKAKKDREVRQNDFTLRDGRISIIA